MQVGGQCSSLLNYDKSLDPTRRNLLPSIAAAGLQTLMQSRTPVEPSAPIARMTAGRVGVEERDPIR